MKKINIICLALFCICFTCQGTKISSSINSHRTFLSEEKNLYTGYENEVIMSISVDLVLNVFVDNNFNGEFNNPYPDTGVQGMPVTLELSNGDNLTQSTNASGQVVFNGIQVSGTITGIISFNPPVNYLIRAPGCQILDINGPCRVSYEFTSDAVQLINLLVSKNPSLRIRKLTDNNENHQFDASDQPIPGWSFTITFGNTTTTIVTDQDGYVVLNNLDVSGLLTITENPNTLFLTNWSWGTFNPPGTISFTLGPDNPYDIQILNSKTPLSPCSCHGSTVSFHWLVPPVNSHAFLNIQCQNSYPGFYCYTVYKLFVIPGCNSSCQNSSNTITVTYPDGFQLVTNSPFNFIPNIEGIYMFNITSQCDNVPCPPCVFTVKVEPCPTQPCTCPDATITGQNYDLNAALYPSTSSATLNMFLNVTGNYEEIRANVVDFNIYAQDDQGNPSPACLQCYNDPQSWGSLVSGTLGNASNQPMINGTVTTYPGIGVTASTFNPHEIVFSNSGIFSVQNKPLSLKMVLPGASPIACCHLFADVTLKITFRNADCEECEEFISGTIQISPQNGSQPFKITETRKIRLKTPSANNYGITDEGIKREVNQPSSSVNNYGITDEGIKAPGEPVPDIKISVDYNGSFVANVITDQNGEFSFAINTSESIDKSIKTFQINLLLTKAQALKYKVELTQTLSLKVKLKPSNGGVYRGVLTWWEDDTKTQNRGTFAVSGKSDA